MRSPKKLLSVETSSEEIGECNLARREIQLRVEECWQWLRESYTPFLLRQNKKDFIFNNIIIIKGFYINIILKYNLKSLKI